jgi:hypothetical protein
LLTGQTEVLINRTQPQLCGGRTLLVQRYRPAIALRAALRLANGRMPSYGNQE